MNRILSVFGAERVLLPVVHPIGWTEAMRSVRIAHEVGTKGVFLIDQGMSAAEVLRLVVAVRRRFPSLWVGVNLLGRRPAEALRLALDSCEGSIDGLWADDAEIDEGASASAQLKAQEFVDARRAWGWEGLYFGGVSFKYQRVVRPDRLAAAVVAAAPHMDVICTSGPATGKAAEPTKLASMRAAAGPDVALALASGVNASNVAEYLPNVNAFLVGTGIEENFGRLSPGRTAALQASIAGPVSRT